MRGRHVFPLLLLALALMSLLPTAATGGPGNGKIAFTSEGRLVAVDPVSGVESDLGAGSATSWSPDGTQIAFLAGGAGVFVMNADGGARRLLHAGDDRQPVWSPDGSRVAFVHAQQNGGSLVVVEVGSGDAKVVASPAVQGAWPPSWSPDGTRIAFTEGPSDLAVVGPDGSGHRVLVGGTGLEAGPAWSPDGTKIAFMHGETGALPALHVVDADGGSLRRLTHTASYVFNLPGTPVPAWSPDGTRIAFTGTTICCYSRYGPTYLNDVYVVDAEGTLERRLTSGGGSSSAIWSPDGRRIAFNGVYVMNPDGTCETKIGSRAGHSPSWQTVADAPAAPLLLCADLELTVHGERGSVAAGGEETFRISVKDLENMQATGVRLRAESPAGGSFVSATPDRGTCSLENGALACELGALRVGEVVGVKVLARAAGVGVFSSAVRATATEPDGYQSNNSRQLRFEALPCTIVGGASGSIVIGTRGRDTICTLYGPDVIHGLAGADSIDAGAGPDRVFPGAGRDRVMLRAGADFLDALDGQRDTIECGGERDLVLADPIDRIGSGCELVARPEISRCKTVGSGRSDRLVGTARSDSVCALSGHDEINTLGGADAVDAGGGNDVVVGGPGRDLLLGGEGYDRIVAHDGARDRIRCGPQFDTVVADRLDIIGGCERVIRR
jgi:Tol biopolymer transport system component